MNETLSAVRTLLREAEAVVVGAGSGMSAAAGLTYAGRRFHEKFGDFIEHYGMTDMYSAGFYPFSTQEEKWSYWSRHIYYNRYDVRIGKPYLDLLQLVKDRNYFILTTNVDHQFQMAGFPEERIFAVPVSYTHLCPLIPRFLLTSVCFLSLLDPPEVWFCKFIFKRNHAAFCSVDDWLI